MVQSLMSVTTHIDTVFGLKSTTGGRDLLVAQIHQLLDGKNCCRQANDLRESSDLDAALVGLQLFANSVNHLQHIDSSVCKSAGNIKVRRT